MYAMWYDAMLTKTDALTAPDSKLPPLERLCNDDAAAQACGGERLIGEQFREGEFERPSPGQAVVGGSADQTPDPSLCHIGAHLHHRRRADPPRLGAFRQVHEGLCL